MAVVAAGRTTRRCWGQVLRRSSDVKSGMSVRGGGVKERSRKEFNYQVNYTH